MMNFKELVLWLFFLILCLSAGFYKGHAPTESGPSFMGGPVEIEILLTDEMFLPADIRDLLQKKLDIQIKTLVVHDREEFAIRTITSPGYHLALIPDHWIGPANLAHQMSNLDPLIDRMSKIISSDFLKVSDKKTGGKLYSVPLFWMATGLKRKSDSSPENPKKYFFLKDWDQLTTKSSELNIAENLIEPWEFFKVYPAPVSGSVYEISHLMDLSGWVQSDLNYTSLYVWSLCSPRHSPSRKMTLKLIEALTETDVQLKMVAALPLASTLKSLDEESLPRNKKSVFVRDLDLSHMKKPLNLSLEQLKQIKIDYAR